MEPVSGCWLTCQTGSSPQAGGSRTAPTGTVSTPASHYYRQPIGRFTNRPYGHCGHASITLLPPTPIGRFTNRPYGHCVHASITLLPPTHRAVHEPPLRALCPRQHHTTTANPSGGSRTAPTGTVSTPASHYYRQPIGRFTNRPYGHCVHASITLLPPTHRAVHEPPLRALCPRQHHTTTANPSGGSRTAPTDTVSTPASHYYRQPIGRFTNRPYGHCVHASITLLPPTHRAVHEPPLRTPSSPSRLKQVPAPYSPTDTIIA